MGCILYVQIDGEHDFVFPVAAVGVVTSGDDRCHHVGSDEAPVGEHCVTSAVTSRCLRSVDCKAFAREELWAHNCRPHALL